MYEDFKPDRRPSSSMNNPTTKYNNVKKDPVTCITSRPQIVIDKRKRKQTEGAFICVRSKLVQKKKSRYDFCLKYLQTIRSMIFSSVETVARFP